MSVKINCRYLGSKKVELHHQTSGQKLVTVPPVDNQGDGSSFSPTDLTSASLGACMLTIMGIYAEREGIDLTGANVEVEKIMSAAPRRIGQLNLTFRLPAKLDEQTRQKLQRAGETCPVHHSLHPDVKVEVVYDYSV